MNINYIRLLNAIEAFASAHIQIRRFASDFPEQMPNFATIKESYPVLFVSPSNVIFNENANQFTLTIYCWDIIEKDRANINPVLSVTNQILNDLYIWFEDGNIAGIDIIDQLPTLTPLNNGLLDYAAGWQMILTFTVGTYGICEIPFNESPVVVTEVNDVVYSQYLTCETLSSCGTIIDILSLLPTQDEKDALDAANNPSISNPFATIADISGGGESLAATLAIGNTTNEIPIISNNGFSSAYINDTLVRLDYNEGVGGTSGRIQITPLGSSWLWSDAFSNSASISLDAAGILLNSAAINIAALAGTGTQMVVANASGDLSRQAIPSSTNTLAQTLVFGNSTGGLNIISPDTLSTLGVVDGSISLNTAQINLTTPVIVLSDEAIVTIGNGAANLFVAGNAGYSEFFFTVSNGTFNSTIDQYADPAGSYITIAASNSIGGNQNLSLDAGTGKAVYKNSDNYGIEYNADYSSTYTNRTLVDKEYVDNAIPSTPALSAVLTAGNSAGSNSINMNNNAITSASTVEINNGGGYEIKFTGGASANIYNSTVSQQLFINTNSGNINIGCVDGSSSLQITPSDIIASLPIIGSTIRAASSAGLLIEANGGTDAILIGAGGGGNVTFYDGVKLDSQTASKVLATDSSKNIQTITLTKSIGLSLDGQGGVISTGSKGFSLPSFTGTIVSWHLKGNDAVTGSIVIDVKRSGASIVGAGNKPTITSANSATALVSGWTSTTISAGDEIEFNVDSCSTFTTMTLEIKINLTI